MIALQRVQNEIAVVSQYRLPIITSNLRCPDICRALLGVKEMTQQGFPINFELAFTVAVNNGVVKITVGRVEIIEIAPFATIKQITA